MIIVCIKALFFCFIFIQGQCFIALDPGVFAAGFEDRMQALMDHCRNLQPVNTQFEFMKTDYSTHFPC